MHLLGVKTAVATAVVASAVACGPAGSAPSLDPLEDQVAVVGRELVVALRASDRDGDALEYSFSSAVPEIASRATVSKRPDGSGVFRWTPRAADVSDGWYFDFTARDADIIKTYVRMGMGVGVVASMAYECTDQDDLAAIDAEGLFPRVTTWLGFRRDSVLRGYMVEFISLFAPHLNAELTRRAAELETQAEVDTLFADIALPVRGGCSGGFADAA